MLALAGATALVSTATLAADFPPALPPPMPQYMQAPPPVDTSGWYLRGDVGVGKQSITGFNHFQSNSAFVWPASWRIDQLDMGDASMVGFGVGYAWNSWMRFDFTGEYRASAKFKTIGSYTEFCPNGRCFDVYDGGHHAWLFLANAYLDLGTWWCLTPFIGVGAGGGYHTVGGLTDVGYISDGTTGFGYAASSFSKFNFAWAVHAGLAYNVTNNFKVEFSYRYLDMGSVQTPIIDCAAAGCSATGGPRAYYTLNSLTSQDFRIGMRWMLQPETIAPPPVYTPPPPLMRRG
jgi:opacity protein-like surface antigen